jgi:hypothetical protein
MSEVGATQSDSSQFRNGSGWDVSRRYPDKAERVHVVLSREIGLVSVLDLPRDRDPGFYQSSNVDWGSQQG